MKIKILFLEEDDEEEDEAEESGTDEGGDEVNSKAYTIKYSNEVSNTPTRITLQLANNAVQQPLQPTPIKKGRRGKIQRKKVSYYKTTTPVIQFVYELVLRPKYLLLLLVIINLLVKENK